MNRLDEKKRAGSECEEMNGICFQRAIRDGIQTLDGEFGHRYVRFDTEFLSNYCI